MRRLINFAVPVLALTFLSGCVTTREAGTARETKHPTPLDSYVAAPDDSFAYELANTVDGDGYTLFMLNVTSQTWPAPEEVDRPVWKHWVIIAKPDEVRSKTALLFIGGGRNRDEVPQGGEEEFIQMAKASGGVVVMLGQIPNQPLIFKADGTPRVEDEFISYTWDKYLRTGDPMWLARLPMTKGAVRAMDAVQGFMATEAGGTTEVDSFVVAGGSKRGWTTWTTAAVDKRVVGIIPIVIDLLNVVPSFQHHYKAYGFWAPAVGDYQAMGLMDWSGTPEYDAMLKIVEPFTYRDRYTMPKLVMNATGDQFFLPDSSQFYYDQLPNPKRLRYVPNGDHGLDETDAAYSILSFYQAIIGGTSLPQYSWTFPGPDTTRVMSIDKPVEVKLWQAFNPNARDFRVESIGKIWEATPLQDLGGSVFEAKVETPQQGYRAFMIELTYAGPTEAAPFKFTTPVRVVPDTYPHGLPEVPNPPKGFLSSGK
ncbi:MAG: PhoPQ-activated pathogenicity-related family protein [Candidatus Hydrogenedentes bacterium]|nr:PhoPQ-activated pathogenicity-related family protein [Candidatus Hydrogenedentota bacterium]MBI3119400.1 PhoPQ-activated pathogenicity-related family protein [Candidatus Hydrogenedentota bacterium]